MSRHEIVKRGLETGKKATIAAWQFATSEKAIAIINVAISLTALISSVEKLRRMNRKIGFRK